MDDLIIYRRKRPNGKFIGNEQPVMKVEYEKGRFIVFKKLADAIGAKDNDAIMFSFSKSRGCAYIFKESPEVDSYYLSLAGPSRPYFRFTSKSLSGFFREIFEIPIINKVSYFELTGSKNDKGHFEIKLQSN